jgi:hypothetical protein
LLPDGDHLVVKGVDVDGFKGGIFNWYFPRNMYLKEVGGLFANHKRRGTIEAAKSGWGIYPQAFFATDQLVRRKPLRLGWHQGLII